MALKEQLETAKLTSEEASKYNLCTSVRPDGSTARIF